jgi:hypothetical protein
MEVPNGLTRTNTEIARVVRQAPESAGMPPGPVTLWSGRVSTR